MIFIKKNIFTTLSISFCVLLFFAFKTIKTTWQVPTFVEAHKDFPKEKKNLRKWDAPTVADLDQDGYLDLILNNHGLGIKICWNNKGRFAIPIAIGTYDLIMGDLHGVTVGDFDKDGNMEMVVSRGGGSGSNARNSKIFRVDRKRNFTTIADFQEPLALMRGRTVQFFDGNNDGHLDLINFAFPDQSKKGASENYIYKNDGKGQLKLTSTLPSSKKDGQKTLLTDFNNDGIMDMILYGHGEVKAYQGQGDLTYKNVTKAIFPKKIENVTGVTEIDFDNDGDFDLFFTRGKDFDIGETFYDPDTKTWAFTTKRGAFNFEIETGDILQFENYHTQWPNINTLYIGETGYDYEYKGEKHSGKDLRLVNSNALGFPDKMNKKGIHIGYIGNRKWRIAGNTWSSVTGVVHGVESYPKYEHQKGLNDILLENRPDGKSGVQFKDATQNANLQLEEHTTGVATADLDNNGFQDLIIIRRGDFIHKNQALIYMNKGNATFEKLEKHPIISPELGAIGVGVETFDYNKDGKIDIMLGNERGKWHLFKNTIAEKTNHITVEVGNSPKDQASPLDAIVTIKNSCTQQTKRVGSTSAMYSRSHNTYIHFGLGECKKPLIIVVKWSNGETIEKTINEINLTTIIGKKKSK